MNIFELVMPMLSITMPYIIFFVLIGMIFTIIDYKKYNKSMYKSETDRTYLAIRLDKGLRGEYYTSTFLNKIEGEKKFIFNAYIPKNDTEETSEIDIIMINEKGIFVIENKNYSGWIFGKEKDKKWCQTFNKNSKYYFYNPVRQNNSHIKYLKQFLKNQKEIPYISIISFNDDAKLKKVTIESSNIILCNSSDLKEKIEITMKETNSILTNEEINQIYEILKEKTKVSQEVKEQHIKNIQENIK